MGNELTIAQKDMLSTITAASLGELIKPLTNEILLFDTYIAGTSHVRDESAFDEIKEGDKVTLQREPDNRFDENAILVLNSKSKKLGYVPEKDNTVFARLMDAGKYRTAKIEHIEPNGSFRQIDISIYLVDF